MNTPFNRALWRTPRDRSSPTASTRRGPDADVDADVDVDVVVHLDLYVAWT